MPELEGARAAWLNRFQPPQPTDSSRKTGLVQALVGFVAGGLIYRFAAPAAGVVVLSLSALLAVIVIVSPDRLYPAIGGVFKRIGKVVGSGIGWLLLVPFFYLVLTPLGLILQLRRRDPLQRRLDPDRDSYWQRPENDWSDADLRRQF